MAKIERFLVLQTELKPYVKAMGQAADVIINENVSNYPIFIAHQQEFEMGLLLIDPKVHGGKWSIHASTLEEFVTKNIVFSDKVEEFTANFKDPSEQICVFVLSDLGANFIYLPRN